MTHDGRRRALLAIDTATTRVVIATGTPAGVVDGVSTWTAGYRHGETLLPAIGRFLGEQDIRRSGLVGLVVGTGPGAFTGLRVGIATAKGLAHGLAIPLVGVSTGEALIAGSGVDRRRPPPARRPVGSARRPGRPAADPASRGDGARRWRPTTVLVALDLAGRAPDDALARGEAAHAGLGAALLALGATRLAEPGMVSELETLVPEYVTLPRGVRASGGTVEWSRDPR